MKQAFAVATLLIAAAPLSAAASVSVVTVMYDVPGTDTKREWVEFTTDTAIPDIRTWRFLEGGVRHKITGETGTVPANTRFVLASDVSTYKSEHTDYTGLVFDTSMSLSNSGETIGLIDEKGASVLTHTYTPAPPATPPSPKATEGKQKSSKPEPRVLGAKTSQLEERGSQVAAAVEATSPEWAWFSFGFLGLIVLAGFSVLAFLQLKK